MPARIWKFGFTEVTTATDLPDNAVADKIWRLRASSADFANPLTRRELQNLFQFLGGSLGPSPDLNKPSIQNLLVLKINDAASRGQIVAFRRKAEGGGSSAGAPGSGGGAPPPPPPPPPGGGGGGGGTEKEKTWIEIQLVDEEGNPIAGERYILKITDGSTREGTLDAEGKTAVRGIDPGTCTLRFPDLDAREYKRKS